MVTPDPRGDDARPGHTSTALIQFVDGSFRPRAAAYFAARPGAAPADLAAAGRVCVADGDVRTDPQSDPTPSTPSVLTDHLEAWPADGCGTSLTELGAPTRSGGRLVAVGGVATPPPAFLAWLRASPLGRAVARAYVFPDGPATVRGRSVAEVVAAMRPPPPGAAVRVSAYPRALEAALLAALPEGDWPALATSGASHALLAVDTRAAAPSDELIECGDESADGFSAPPIWAALVPPSFFLGDTTDERSRDPALSPSKAAAKLAEAMRVALTPRALPFGTASTVAIDVGAAPGGWTQHLARGGRFARVLAVEPGDLDGAVAALPAVVHVRSLAEHAADDVRAALAQVGASHAHLLACDANAPLPALPGLVGPMAALLAPGAPALITLKCSTPSREKDRAAAAAAVTLKRVGLRVVWCLWLAANTRCERTLVCVKEG
jgi:hypothetical protein